MSATVINISNFNLVNNGQAIYNQIYRLTSVTPNTYWVGTVTKTLSAFPYTAILDMIGSSSSGVSSVIAGTGINVSSATGNVTITNTLPDQTVVLNSGTGISVTGTYPNFTITNTSPSSGGTVTSVSVVTANGISGSVATATTTPAITLTLGAITPTSVNGITLSGSGSISNSGTTSLTSFTGSGTSSGTNTGDQNFTASGDATAPSSSSNLALTLATVNSNVGTFGSATKSVTVTVNGKGLITAISEQTITGFVSNTLTNTHIFVGNASNVATDVAMSGDATLANTGALTIANNAVTYAKMQAVSTTSKLLGSSSTTTAVQEITLGSNLSMSGTTLNAASPTGANVTAGSNKITLGGTPTGAALVAFSIDVDQTKLDISAMIGTLQTTRGGTGIDTSGSTGVVQVSGGTWSASTALANGTTATTQSANDNSTKVATTAYIDNTSYHDGHITINPYDYSAITAGTWAFGSDSGQYANGRLYNSTGAVNNQIDYIFGCSAGTWTISVLSLKASDAAIITFLIDGSSVGTADGYNSTTQLNQRLQVTGITLTAGSHTLSLKAATKNASSSSYVIRITNIGLWRTA